MAKAIPAATEITHSLPRDFEMISRTPGFGLRGIVTAIVGYKEAARGHFRQVQPASLAVPLIVSFGEPFAIGLGRHPSANGLFGSFAAGLHAGPVVIDSFGRSECIQIDFTPLAARRFFGLPMHELADSMVDLDDLPGLEGAALRERLVNETDWDRRFDLVEDLIGARVGRSEAPSPEIAWAYARLAETGGRIRIGDVADAVGWSRKHFGHRFASDVGLGPKSVARLLRFNRALDAARRGEDEWAGIAASCGYADQAHLVREFREFAGVSPTEFDARRLAG